jgi:hypothetical protein
MKAVRLACVVVAAGAALAQVAQAQEASSPVPIVAQGGGGRGGGTGVGSGSGQGRARGGGGGTTGMRVPIEGAPVKGAPYFAEVVTESVQNLADGNRIVRKTTGRVYRDSQGRVRREDDREPGHVRVISITDPVAGAAWSLNPETKVAWKTGYSVAGIVGAKALVFSTADPAEFDRAKELAAKIREAQDALKEKQAAGGGGVPGGTGVIVPLPSEMKVEAKTEKLPARAIGNEQPIAIVTEQWRSPELQVLVLTRTSDPRSGETTYRLLGITRAEQAPSWFEVPADYTVRETGIKREAPRQ